MGVKQAILQHEYGEVMKRRFFGLRPPAPHHSGQAEKLELDAGEFIDTKPITTTTAFCYSMADAAKADRSYHHRF